MGGVTSSSYSRTNLAGLVRRTIEALKNANLPLDMPGSSELEQSRRQLLTQLQSRILPHLESQDLPAIVVFGGSSGAGKSTLVNSLVREEISPASVLRPTTRTPVVALHPEDARVMESHALGEMATVKVVEGAIPGVAIVDAPDLDSVDDSNRELSARLLDSADLWVFVTTAARYGDAVAWNTLQMAHMRGVTCAVVLDRVPERAMASVRGDLIKRMDDLGLAESPLFIIPDQGAHSGLLDASVVAEVRDWLGVISKTKVGNALVDRTTQATLPSLREDLLRLADALENQEHALFDLKDQATEAIQAPLDKLMTNIANGRFGQGAPTASWLAMASTGGALAGLVAERKPGFLDRKQTVRDNAMTSIFDTIYSSARIALTQGVIAARANADDAWGSDFVDTTEFRAQVADEIDEETIIEDALAGWKADLARISKQAPENAWLSESGTASLIGTAAGGIAGANTVARARGLESFVNDAREALVGRVREALESLAGVYTGVVDGVTVGDSAALRLRASEFMSLTGGATN